MEKNDTYQDQHLEAHKKSIDDLAKMIKNFTNKLNQMSGKKGDEGNDPKQMQHVVMPSFDDDAIDEVKNGLAELEKMVRELKERKVENEQYDLDVYKIN